MIKTLKRLYFFLTTYLPRRLPTSDVEFENMKFDLVSHYDVSDTAQVWATVAGHITSTPSSSVRRSYGYLANVARRLTINAVAQNQRQRCIAELEAKLAVAFKKEADAQAAAAAKPVEPTTETKAAHE